MSKFVNDVRSSSSDARYMGVVFSGSMKNAIKQAKKAVDHGLPQSIANAPAGMSRGRAALLQFLNLLPKSDQSDRVVLKHARIGLYFSNISAYSGKQFAVAMTRAEAQDVAGSLRKLGMGPFVVEAIDAPAPRDNFSLAAMPKSSKVRS